MQQLVTGIRSLSEDVVTGYRASGYLDVFAGEIHSEVDRKGANRVFIQLETDGPPVLSIEPFRTAGPSAQAGTVVLDAVPNPMLIVSNLEVDPTDSDPPFDFMLHYLTARGGLPRVITRTMPGIGTAPSGLSLPRSRGFWRALPASSLPADRPPSRRKAAATGRTRGSTSRRRGSESRYP